MKKEKMQLSEEQKLEKKEQTKQSIKLGFKEGIIPFFIQFGILIVVILQFVFIIASEGNPLVPGVPDWVVGGHVINDSNWVRLIYMFLCIPAIIILLKFSVKANSIKKSFWLSLIAGIIAWQMIGECSWHFGLHLEETFVFFPVIEGLQGTFLLLLFAPIFFYLNKKGLLPWFLKIFLLSFFANWIGHWLILGIAPMWPVTLLYHNPQHWPKIAGILFGLHGSMMLVYRILFKAKTTEERLVLSVMLYMFVGIFVEGFLGLGASLE